MERVQDQHKAEHKREEHERREKAEPRKRERDRERGRRSGRDGAEGERGRRGERGERRERPERAARADDGAAAAPAPTPAEIEVAAEAPAPVGAGPEGSARPPRGRVFVSLGEQDGADEAKVRDAVGALAPGLELRGVELRRTHAFLEVAPDAVEGAVQALNGKDWNGKALTAERARRRRR
jgi:ATP-dependent RNA helicase DeaD